MLSFIAYHMHGTAVGRLARLCILVDCRLGNMPSVGECRAYMVASWLTELELSLCLSCLFLQHRSCIDHQMP